MTRFPRKCACESPHVAWSWITGGPDHPGMAWCVECLDGIGHLSPWAWVPGDTYAGDGDLGEAIRAAPPAPPCMADGAWKAMYSFYGACPLCSRGEHGAEHLAIWHPAVAAAWLRVGASHEPSPVRALSGDRDAVACAARLLHQASFIASSIHNKSAVGWREGADWLVRAICAPDSSEEWDDGGVGTGEPAREGERVYAYVWEEADGCGCWECEDRAGAGRPTSARPGAPARDGGPPTAPGHTVAAATEAIDEGQVVTTLRSRGTPASWINPGEHWWLPSRVVHPWEYNIDWKVHACGRCRQEKASLVATRPIQRGDELRAGTGYPSQVYPPRRGGPPSRHGWQREGADSGRGRGTVAQGGTRAVGTDR